MDDKNCLIGVIAHRDRFRGNGRFSRCHDRQIGRYGRNTFLLPNPLFQAIFSAISMAFGHSYRGLAQRKYHVFFSRERRKGVDFSSSFLSPLITGMSGNIGIQCSTLLVRSMAIGTFSWGNKKDSIFKELAVGFFNGSVLWHWSRTRYLFCRSFFLKHISPLEGHIGFYHWHGTFSELLHSHLFGGLFFTFCFFAKIHFYAILLFASGPLITVFNNFFSMTIYFLIARSLVSAF